ncbi:ABC transporter ATP-binding protein [Rhizobium ruizarguesonis]|jgi:peptide/nickel transport system ATP-binding protein|uniref:ABC transporter ATP-binding protein n=1 Tax=Rhizobium ruizarguesonis TaxID=2081791 RepID=UPI00102F5BA6|nr:ABC transporter ATP-binding protein [Rhizobium ruizarguesonis]TBA12752.1 ABC transporter ATP-binding protein [Rhizobium ruizarguesonis]TBA45940.1 ABC transporter ATP-binding protein [Rhizobium ruizarguesonis]TBA93877.1 ABC transporter ATP-binding protein [Rhizobium ruizarguesonis]TBA95221.1 ABC transporter ATP-binding protein [Rhizobium ruizarguesonis]TBB36526.1 ABC transporter ATP-binding protein [Rhizobium ruizarguesonis]
MSQQALLEIRNLSIDFPNRTGIVHAVNDVSWSINPGQTLAILGESGSGKSVSASAVLDLVDSPPAVIASGQILYRGQDLLKSSKEERRAINGKKISMIFQDPLAALNPVYPVGWQIAETLRVHGVDKATAHARVIDLLARVGIEEPERRARQYPHQFSGGQRQRIMIASAIALEPDLLIADEPTSALDVTVQAQVLALLKKLQSESGMGIVLITHDLSVVEKVADRVVVMQDGRIVESGTSQQIMTSPQHPYTRKLLDAMPGRHGFDATQEAAIHGRTLLEVDNVSRIYGIRPGKVAEAGPNAIRAVNEASFVLKSGETLGIVGESGSGKSTLARMLLGLDKPTIGEIRFDGKDLNAMSAAETFKVRRRMQFVFQDPTASLNPRMRIGQIIAEPWAIHADVLPRKDWRGKVIELLERVGLKADHIDRYPHQFSGGQRQRIAIARSLALNPEVIVCDEAVSALDVSIQAKVIDLLKQLRSELGLSYIFIAHDLALVRDFATDVVVMYRGRIVEKGKTADVYNNPQNDYTKRLLSASMARLPTAA